MAAFDWCAPLASVPDDVLGAVVREVCTRRASSTPSLLRIGHRRAHEVVQVAYGEGNRTVREERSRWWLHIGVVFEGDAATDAREVEATHPALARDLQEAALRWADCWPILHRHARTDAALREYYRTPLDARCTGDATGTPAPPRARGHHHAGATRRARGTDPGRTRRGARAAGALRMTLIVHTARLGTYRGGDGLDVTRKSGEGDALAFAPSWAILRPALADMQSGRELVGLARSPVDDMEGRWLQSAAWGRYWRAYLGEMAASYRARRPAWDALLARPSVVLLCYCADASHCHRSILAREILPKLGATFAGERAPDEEEQLFGRGPDARSAGR